MRFSDVAALLIVIMRDIKDLSCFDLFDSIT